MNAQNTQSGAARTPDELARVRAARQRYQSEKPTPEQLLSEGGHTEFATMAQVLGVRCLMARLKQSRLEAGLTIAEAASRAEMDPAAFSRLESGKSLNPTLATIAKVAAALGKEIRFEVADLEADADA